MSNKNELMMMSVVAAIVVGVADIAFAVSNEPSTFKQRRAISGITLNTFNITRNEC